MAIRTLTTDIGLRLSFSGGRDANGKAITRNKLYRFVKLDANPEGMYDAAAAIASLQTDVLQAVYMTSAVDLTKA
ncbi:DUF1659 domain-containing protein [Ectobacillus ponti]|uniref:DUF1659 domain-containing protein n=1 Tax=Ectobacillus ponti TaxID=2961894 RepID=A0AA41X5U1_9BACI|nr:DUF1659 domain-containing protein [Ectobacillus ponti]MCP8967713.1 DUF1659 domain-containing protein [Ectobacillus ponti]